MKTLFKLIFLTSLPIISFSQITLKADSFYQVQAERPANYHSLIFDPRGWNLVAVYFVDNKEISTKTEDIGPNTRRVFYQGTKMTDKVTQRINGDKMIIYGDRRSKAKIIYIDDQTFIIELDAFRKGKVTKATKNSNIIESQKYIKTKARFYYKH